MLAEEPSIHVEIKNESRNTALPTYINRSNFQSISGLLLCNIYINDTKIFDLENEYLLSVDDSVIVLLQL